MKFPLAVVAATIPILGNMAFAAPLDAFRGVNRLIVVSLSDGPSAEKLAATLIRHREKIIDRDLKIIDISGGISPIPNAVRLPPDQTYLLRKQLELGAGDGGAVFILIGKDGGEKARQHGTLDLEKWFSLIDEMPMRRQEIQNQKNKIP